MTNEELSIEIAKRRGWRFKATDDEGNGFLLDPDGHSVFVPILSTAVNRAYPNIRYIALCDEDYDDIGGISTGADMGIIADAATCWYCAPQFAEDMNAAIELYKEMQPIGAELYTTSSGFWCVEWGLDSREGREGNDNPARAICLAWLAWKDGADGDS